MQTEERQACRETLQNCQQWQAFMLVHPSGGRRWRYKYRYGGKEKVLAFGVYPDVTSYDVAENVMKEVLTPKLKRLPLRMYKEKHKYLFKVYY